jgi:hypothetical protein
MNRLTGKQFEVLTSNEYRLLLRNYKKICLNKNRYGYYLHKQINEDEYVFVSQSGFRHYAQRYLDIDFRRYPDEAYITKKDKQVKILILEKKIQSVQGSVDQKLYSAPLIREEYQELCHGKAVIEYGFCLGYYFQHMFRARPEIKRLLCKHDIKIMFGMHAEYYKMLDEWTGFI